MRSGGVWQQAPPERIWGHLPGGDRDSKDDGAIMLAVRTPRNAWGDGKEVAGALAPGRINKFGAGQMNGMGAFASGRWTAIRGG